MWLSHEKTIQKKAAEVMKSACGITKRCQGPGRRWFAHQLVAGGRHLAEANLHGFTRFPHLFLHGWLEAARTSQDTGYFFVQVIVISHSQSLNTHEL